jgi:hypothetical protein
METDHEELHRELESQGDDMETRRDELARETDAARHDVSTKVSDQRVPGFQDEQEDVLQGREAVEEGQEEDEGEESEEQGGESEGDDSEGGGSEGAGYREE